MTAQVPANATADELKKIKEEATARKEAFEELTKADTAKKAWDALQDPSKTSLTDQSALAKTAKDVADAQTAAANAQKAQADAATAAVKAKFGEIPASGYTGAVELGTGAGSAEAMLLGAAAVNAVAKTFAARIAADKPAEMTRVVLVTAQTVPDFQALLAFNAQFDALDAAVQRARDTTDAVLPADGSAQLVAVATLGLGLDAINKVLAFAKTDYKFQDLPMVSSDAMLLSALAGPLRAAGLQVQIPSIYQANAFAASNPVLAKISKVFGWSSLARQRISLFEGTQATLQKQSDAAPADAAIKARLQQVKEAVLIWKAVADGVDAWAKQATGTDDKGAVPLAVILRQAALRAELDAKNVALVVIQLHKVAGTGYTQKNIWSSLGANPFHVMGGAVAGYVALRGETGEAFSAMLLPRHGGYHAISDVMAVVNAGPPKP